MMHTSLLRFIRLLGDTSLIVITVVAMMLTHNKSEIKRLTTVQYTDGSADVQLIPPRIMQRSNTTP
ncbi:MULTISPECIES: hypothetical protein [unclassified Leptolyngbya]|uniref:hypothetical protein n=1 Tax=unclassified Leptolyngbya TaxID=2650499 RepID=UPI001684B9E5|nr:MULTISPECIES: hypothetical protein [unclassified Leptolyngbya]MBD1913358.1 hypothetical protein [Leptolyngbya sp. FACHB-8]MBD2158711.1 hypothetical protein [Leptolyngbya sp. FACHB-16]